MCPVMTRNRSYSSAPSSRTSRAFSASVSCCQDKAMVFSAATRVFGVASTMPFPSAWSCSPGSASQAAASSDSPGMKATTNSGERSNCRQYSFLASWSTWVRSWLACFLRKALRSSSSSDSVKCKKASSGTFESMTTWPPPGRCTIMSGRSRPSAVAVDRCSSKSQCSAIPAALTALRSVISPQRPLVCGDRRAVTRFLVSFCNCSWPRCSAATRSFNVA